MSIYLLKLKLYHIMKIKLPYFGECDDEQLGYLLLKIKVEHERCKNYSDAFRIAENSLENVLTKESIEMLEDLKKSHQANCEDAKSAILKVILKFFNGTPLI